MKTIKSGIYVVLITILMGVSSVQAATYTPDTFLGSEDIKSGHRFELAAMESFAGEELVQVAKRKANVHRNKHTNDEWYVNARSKPDYFLLKFGTGHTGTKVDHYFFKNIDQLKKLVWSDSDVSPIPAHKLSHYTAYNVVGAVPIPAAAWLFGSGLLGLIGVSRRKSASALSA